MHLLAETSIRIDRVLPEVFDFTVDLENYPRWFPEVDEMKAVDDRPTGEVGKRYAEIVRDGSGATTPMTVEVAECVRDVRLVTQAGFEPIQPRMTIAFRTCDADSTEVTWTMESRNDDPPYVEEILPFVRQVMQERAQAALPKLKALLEG